MLRKLRRWYSMTAVMALILGVGVIAVVRHGTTTVAAAQPRAQAVKSVRLYVFNLGNIPINDSKALFAESLELAPNGCCIIVGYLIVHPKGTLMWDTGVVPDVQLGSGAQQFQRRGGLTIEPPKRSLKDQLAEIGYSPEDITYVAFSHLHFDHVANANAFQDSTWIVQEAERDAMFPEEGVDSPERNNYSALKTSKTIVLANMDEYDYGLSTIPAYMRLSSTLRAISNSPSEGVADERQHAARVQHAQPRDERHCANQLCHGWSIVAGSEVEGPCSEDGLEQKRIQSGDHQKGHFCPPGSVVHVLLRVSDEKRHARGQVEDEPEDRQRHQVPGSPHGNGLHEPHEAQVEETGDPDHERQADEMYRFAERPDPWVVDDGGRDCRALQPIGKPVHGVLRRTPSNGPR